MKSQVAWPLIPHQCTHPVSLRPVFSLLRISRVAGVRARLPALASLLGLSLRPASDQ